MVGAMRAIFFFFYLLPMPVGIFITRTIARFIFWVDRRHRRIAMVNLDIAFPEMSPKKQIEIVRKSYQNLGEQLVHMAHFPRLLKPEKLHKLIQIEGLDQFLKLKEMGQPMLFLTGHLGFWEMMAFAHGVLTRRFHFIIRSLNQPLAENMLRRYRSLSGNVAIPKQNASRKILRLLSQGEDVGILVDQNVQAKEGVFIDFFGKKACMTPGFAALALKSGAAVIPAFLVPASGGGPRYSFQIWPEIPTQRTGNTQADILSNTQRYANVLESAIRRWPECWLWGHRRWRTRPADDPVNPYEDI